VLRRVYAGFHLYVFISVIYGRAALPGDIWQLFSPDLSSSHDYRRLLLWLLELSRWILTTWI